MKRRRKRIRSNNHVRNLAIVFGIIAVVACGFLFAASNGVFTPLDSINSDNIKKYWSSSDAKEGAQELVDTVYDLNSAIQLLDANMAIDKDGSLKEMRDELCAEYEKLASDRAYQHIYAGDYAAAAEELKTIAALQISEDSYISKLYDTCIRYQDSVKWEGPVEHIFFHSLIYDTEKTFIGDYQTEGFDDFFVTTGEFKRILQKFYEANYILYDIRDLFTVHEDGTVSKNDVYIPEGKKPLVMSFDDINYYEYMSKYGFVDGLMVDENGEVCTFEYTSYGSREVVEEGDYIPILENFLKEHPDFSWNGAKGTLGLTGYEGAFGYRTHELNAINYDERFAEAKKVADRLKEMNWSLASHSYNHRGFNERDEEWYARDVARWKAEVGIITGETYLYLYPFGDAPKDWDDPKHINMVDNGFKMFCGVYQKPQFDEYDNFLFMQRRNIDGIAFREDRLLDMIDMTGVVDIEARPDRGYH